MFPFFSMHHLRLIYQLLLRRFQDVVHNFVVFVSKRAKSSGIWCGKSSFWQSTILILVILHLRTLASEILELKNRVEEKSQSAFNFLLVNRYEHGEDYMGWHRDNEKNTQQVIASLSLGARRKFSIKVESSAADYWLDSGSLLIFDGHLEHRLPKMKTIDKVRINLTFRNLTDWKYKINS